MAKHLIDLMAEQLTTDEMQEIHDADFSGAYDTMVMNAREVRRSVARLVAAARETSQLIEAYCDGSCGLGSMHRNDFAASQLAAALAPFADGGMGGGT